MASTPDLQAVRARVLGQPDPFREILSAVADAADVTVSMMIGPALWPSVCWCRFAVVWVARRRLRMSLPEIGRRLGDRHHTTIANAERRACELRQSDRAFEVLTDRLMEDGAA
ncbi:helix-turn-helix domain-containing protein [Tardibacter chloracetimidivorans]|uniref:helix-turn-helix domain-containing protein n=1 Tax=Tardibacter chloracetimidivorans TaxID=1921510 RepID=UPI0009FA2B1E|nr:helix-turn-helix domain-containing protein [Tardibacter chloracetimidivorans]